MVEVVSGVVIREGRVLLSQRPTSKDYPFCWETPGGKVEGNESHHQALARELDEELGITVKSRIEKRSDGFEKVFSIAENALWCGEVKLEGRDSVFLLYYRCEIEDKIEPREGQGFGWFTATEMARLGLTPGNKASLGTFLYLLDGTPT